MKKIVLTLFVTISLFSTSALASGGKINPPATSGDDLQKSPDNSILTFFKELFVF